jgi:4-diphosphocytidyl-2C-methyl-D-erythritol kinase
MYRLLDASRIDGEPQSQPEGWIENDFHLVAPKACLEAIERLRHDGLSPVGLAGSGSAVFGFAQTREQAEAVANALRGEGIKAWATVTLGRSESLQVQVNP